MQMKNLKANWKLTSLIALVFLNLIIWSAVYAVKPGDSITVTLLNIGQGDAILIESANRNTILIDGGKGKAILGELGKALPIFAKTIDVLIGTHPDQDHIGGLPEVLRRYNVGVYLEPGVLAKNSVDDELKKRIEEKKIPHFLARAGQVVDMGDGSYLRILFPDRDVSGLETNDASIVGQFIFGDTCFLLTGDSPIKMEDYLVFKYGAQMGCDVLKAGHHGSRTSTGENYVNFVKPEYAVISAGKDNSYGHPHTEVIERLTNHKIKILSTIDLGKIKMISDGQTIRLK